MLFPVLALLFILVPVVELWLLIRIGQELGAPSTIALVLLTGVVGAALARAQGFAALRRIHEELAAGRLPTAAILDGVLIVVASVLLVTPGVLTDVVGVLLLLPPTRALARVALVRWARKHVRVVTHAPFPGAGAPFPGAQPWARGDVIDVEAEVRDAPPRPEPEPAPRLGSSPP